MEALISAALDQPLWLWLALAGILLAAELATGTGWLLWPAGSAAVTGLVVLAVKVAPAGAVGFFAVLTIVSTLAGRRLLRRPPKGPDINDPKHDLIGQTGAVIEAFDAGLGRVSVAGKDWGAVLEGGGRLAKGAKVRVTGLEGGALLNVKPL